MGGIASALCLLLMMLTIIPIATYTHACFGGNGADRGRD